MATVPSRRDRAKGVAGASSLLVLLRRVAGRERDKESPEAVASEHHIEKLAEHAYGLAVGGREDTEAVNELRAAAGGKRRRLDQAAAVVRFQSPVAESRIADRADRLLRAA